MLIVLLTFMLLSVCAGIAACFLFLLNRNPSTSPPLGNSPGNSERVFAPFWDCSDDSVKWQTCPAKVITLAFVLGNSSGKPMWNGTDPISSKTALCKAIRKAGKDYIVSFGGQAGNEVAQVVKDVGKLFAAYSSVVETLQLKWADFDIEGTSIADTAAVTRRHQAIAKLQKAHPDLTVSFTLPVMPNGLDQVAIAFLKIAMAQGVRVDIVNIMAMDYSESHTGDMGVYAIQATQSTYNQVQQLGLKSTKIGICPMIGVNDIKGEVFTVANARAVREFAQKNSWVRWLTFWAMNRDNTSANPKDLFRSSGIQQREWEFSHEFAKFA